MVTLCLCARLPETESICGPPAAATTRTFSDSMLTAEARPVRVMTIKTMTMSLMFIITGEG
jgi:hypothetical protein